MLTRLLLAPGVGWIGGAHRPLHPNPTRRREVPAERCPHCQADVSGAPQAPVHPYDRIEIPEIAPDVTRVALHDGNPLPVPT